MTTWSVVIGVKKKAFTPRRNRHSFFSAPTPFSPCLGVEKNLPASILPHSLLKRLVRFRAFPRFPVESIVLAAIARPGVEDVYDRVQLRRELRHGPQQDALQWGH